MYQTGDVLVILGSSWISRLIKWFSHTPGEPRTHASHVAIFVNSKTVCEITADGITFTAFADAVAHAKRYVVYRCPHITPDYKIRVIGFCDSAYLRSPDYGFFTLLLYALDSLIGKIVMTDPVLFRRLAPVNRMVCSELVGSCLNYAFRQVLFGPHPEPDDIENFCCKNWQIVEAFKA